MGERVYGLVARLHKGGRKTAEVFGSLSNAQWEMTLYEGPPTWTVRDLLAHFLSAEEGFLRAGQEIAAGGPGAPEGLDYNEYNAAEQDRLAGLSPRELLASLAAAREATIAWVSELDDADMDRMGHHPALGNIALGDFITAIYGHQLMHVRELRALLRIE